MRSRFGWPRKTPTSRPNERAVEEIDALTYDFFCLSETERILVEDAYECKRLNLVRQDGRRSLAGDYVQDGLSRFVVEQYAEGLPLACMLGYVLDGDLEYAESNVRTRIAELRGEVGLVAEPRDAAPIGESKRFFSRHRRQSGAEIEVRHALFPVGPGPQAAGQPAEPGSRRLRLT